MARQRGREGDRLAARVRALTEAVELCDGRVEAELSAEAGRIVRRIDARMAVSGDATVVALAGATGSGKSSTFNALSRSELAAPGVRRPTTSQAMALTWGEEPTEELLDWLQVSRRHALPGGDQLGGLVLLDLPDHDSTELSHRLEVDRLVDLVDVLIWVLDPQKYADAALHEGYLKPLREHAGVMIVVLNQIDRLTPQEADRCLKDLRRLLDSEGLQQADIMAVSAHTGHGIDALRARLAKTVAAKQASAKRLAADVTAIAARLDAAVGQAGPAAAPKRVVQRLDRALAEAASVPLVTEAVAGSWRHRGGLATGWPVLAWLAKLRPDPLRRLHLDRLRPGAGGREIDPARVSRSSLPVASGVQRSRLDSAIREVADASGAGLPRGWADAVRGAASANVDRLPDRLDRAVAATELGMHGGNGWWRGVRLLQWLLVAGVLAGLIWLGVGFALAYLQLPPLPAVTWWNLPAPTVLTLGGVLAGLILAGLSRVGVELGARVKARRAEAALLAAIGAVSRTEVIEPVNAELARHERARLAVRAAAG